MPEAQEVQTTEASNTQMPMIADDVQAAPEDQFPVNTDIDIQEQIEAGLDQLPDDLKQTLAVFSIVPEFGGLMSGLLGPEAGSFFQQFSDPEMTLVVVPKSELDEVLGTIGTEGVIEDESLEETIPLDEEGVDTAFGQELA